MDTDSPDTSNESKLTPTNTADAGRNNELAQLVSTARDWGYFFGAIKERKELWKGRRMLDVGMGGGPHSVGYMEGGALSYVGVDPLVGTEHVRDFRNLKDPSIPAYHEFPYNSAEIMRIYPGIYLYAGYLEEVANQIRAQHKIDIAIMSAISEHLQHPEKVIEGIWSLLSKHGHIWIGHCNYFSWTGHHHPPRSVAAWDTSNARQNTVVDWKHLEPSYPDYTSANYNRIRLEDLRILIAKYFEIIEWTVSVHALNRLTPEIRKKWKKYSLEELLGQNIYITGIRREKPLDIDFSDRQFFHPDENYLADRDYSDEPLEPWSFICSVYFSSKGEIYSHSDNDFAGDRVFNLLKAGDCIELTKFTSRLTFTVAEVIKTGEHLAVKLVEKVPDEIIKTNHGMWSLERI